METIHRQQQNFRQLLHALSYPGEEVSIEVNQSYATRLENSQEANQVNPYAFAVLECLLDGEVTYKTLPIANLSNQELSLYTNSHLAIDYASCNYLWLLSDVFHQENQVQSLEDLSVGTLEDPETSATLIIQMQDLSSAGLSLEVTGPGIPGQKHLSVNLPQAFIKFREKMNHEFPMGIDCLLIDDQGKLIGLPRTTRIEILTDQVVKEGN